ncbi:MAG TPA: metallophosphoesterase [Ohtaekwangia sp.]|uniref:metallophosphoesterase n=1 Tax=Ohtaekwangia sp. TaxID=2066019 RepID=UPI002F94F9B2
MSRTFVMGDIHGASRALRQCLQRADFDIENDHLISLGDVCDGWPETRQCIDDLLQIKNLVYVLGNHDYWTLQWMETGFVESIWFDQGGQATIKSYHDGVPEDHIHFLKCASPYHIANNKLFVHAGIDLQQPFEKQGLDIFLWSRNLARTVLELYLKGVTSKLTTFDAIYIGHTPIPFSKPIHSCEVWMMDTGAGWSGVLSMMDIETNEVYTSDPVPSLYPGVKGRTPKS